jgi:hypothetical protein
MGRNLSREGMEAVPAGWNAFPRDVPGVVHRLTPSLDRVHTPPNGQKLFRPAQQRERFR